MGEYLFVKEQVCDSAYILKNGSVYFELNAQDNFSMSSKNLIFGAVEILLSCGEDKQYTRIMNASTDGSTEYMSISAEKLLNSSHTYNIGFALARSVAELLVAVNKVFSEKKQATNDKEKRSQEYCKLFAWSIDLLESYFEEKRFPWLESIVVESKKSLTYHKGLAFALSDYEGKFALSGEDIDEFHQFFPSGATLCEEGEEAESLYILKEGKLDVLVGQNSIGDIDQPGSVIGEMALLLGGKRNATIKMLENSTLTVVHRNNLKVFIDEHPLFLKNVAIDLSKRVYHNIRAIESLNEWAAQRSDEKDTSLPILHNNEYREELKTLISAIKGLYEKYDMEWIQGLLDKIMDKLLRIKRL